MVSLKTVKRGNQLGRLCESNTVILNISYLSNIKYFLNVFCLDYTNKI